MLRETSTGGHCFHEVRHVNCHLFATDLPWQNWAIAFQDPRIQKNIPLNRQLVTRDIQLKDRLLGGNLNIFRPTCGGQGARLFSLQHGLALLLTSLAGARARQHVGRPPRIMLPPASQHQRIPQDLQAPSSPVRSCSAAGACSRPHPKPRASRNNCARHSRPSPLQSAVSAREWQ